MTRLLAIIERDIKKFVRNPIVVIMSLVMPIVYLVILGNSFQGKLKGLPLAIVDQDSGIYSRRLIDNLRAVEAGARTVSIHMLNDQNAALTGVRNGVYKSALIIPPGFTKSANLRKEPDVGLFLDNTDTVSSIAIKALVNSALNSVREEHVPVRDKPYEFYARNIELYSMVDYYQTLVPGVVIMAIFLGTMTAGVFNLVMDRFLGIDESYLLTPLSKTDIVSGLVISGLFITTLIAFVVLIVSMLITGIPFSKGIEQMFSIFMIIVLTTLALLSLMFVILGRATHPRIVGLSSGFLNVIFFFPSGAIYPIESFPAWLRAFAKVNPEAYAVHALKSVLFKGAGLDVILGDIIFLLIFTNVMMVIAILSFKRTM
ncbi:MAG: ABC transporter permease [Nitrospirae bacterium]|nr:ABC transporter permease [Nitrospirota bacterium]